MDVLIGLMDYLFGHFTQMAYRTFWLFLLTAAILAFFVYARQAGRAWSLRGFCEYLFDRKIWFHRSSVIDYKYFLVNAIVMALIFTPIIGLFYPAILNLSTQAFSAMALPVVEAPPNLSMALYALTYILIVDFSIFLHIICLIKFLFYGNSTKSITLQKC